MDVARGKSLDGGLAWPWQPLPLLSFIVRTLAERRKERCHKKTYFCCQAVVGWSCMGVVAVKTIAVNYSFHYQA